MIDDSILRLTVWSDYVCPFCYLELPILNRLKTDLGDQIDIVWRAFELRPEPVPTLDPDGAYLHRIWSTSVYPMAAERGMTLRLPPVQPRSNKAMEAAEAAREQGRFDAMHVALFEAFFEDGRDLADMGVLLDVARKAGLEVSRVAEALEKSSYTAKVIADAAAACRLGISSVPALRAETNGMSQIINGAHSSYEALAGTLRRWQADAKA
jgi:predicted DsbA family dithiol-disulfide isomerase